MKSEKMRKNPSVRPKAATDRDIARLSLLVPTNMRSRLETLCDRERRSLNQQAVMVMERGLAAIDAAAA
jgi:hypothetical protein